MATKIMPYSTIRIILGEKRIETELHLFNDVLLKRCVGGVTDGRIVCEKAMYIKRTDRTILFLTDSGEKLRLYKRNGIFDGLNLPGIWGKSGYYLDRCD